MSLHNGLDTVAIISDGVWTKTYGSTAPGNIANLFSSYGYFEDAPAETPPLTGGGWWLTIRKRRKRRTK